MASLNRITLIGRLANDPEVRFTSSGLKTARFTVAVDRRFGKGENGEKKTDFFRCNAWRQKADFVEQFVQKGRLVCVEGSVELNDYVGKDGEKKFITEISVDQIENLDSGRDRAGDAAPAPQARGAQSNGNYFADDEPATVRRPTQTAPAARPAPSSAAPQRAQVAPAAARKPAPAPAYPDDDFDDSDPFADE